MDKEELHNIIHESLIICGSKKKIYETMIDASKKFTFNVEFDMDFFVSALSTISKGKFTDVARDVAKKIASIKAISFTDDAILFLGKRLSYSSLQICGKMWDFNKGLYNPHKLFIQEADEILAISSNEAAFLEEIINRIIRKREPDIQSYYLEILENSDSPLIKKICIDILRGNTNCNEDIISKYEAGFKLCQAICLWHNIRYFDDEQIKNQIPSNGNVGKNKDAVGKLEKTRTKKASEKYNNIVEMLVTAEDENYALAYHIHLDVLDYYSSKNTTKKIKENLVHRIIINCYILHWILLQLQLLPLR